MERSNRVVEPLWVPEWCSLLRMCIGQKPGGWMMSHYQMALRPGWRIKSGFLKQVPPRMKAMTM
ncbi:hypothetical protein F7C95_11540 [Opitutia bacterium ISCC 51]|nr:hypothetical protein F7C95_11540 [Opitutae bacterium ISCC 51]QXD26660.1 hypothetical protein GA003_11470 [Opitutae bacterium ISCC 52]